MNNLQKKKTGIAILGITLLVIIAAILIGPNKTEQRAPGKNFTPPQNYRDCQRINVDIRNLSFTNTTISGTVVNSGQVDAHNVTLTALWVQRGSAEPRNETYTVLEGGAQSFHIETNNPANELWIGHPGCNIYLEKIQKQR